MSTPDHPDDAERARERLREHGDRAPDTDAPDMDTAVAETQELQSEGSLPGVARRDERGGGPKGER